jgi:large subunit ribosomal protein L31
LKIKGKWGIIYIAMKKDIHPKYFSNAQVECSCGNTFTVGSTKNKIEIEVCSACHPFFSGEEKLIDTSGRVEKFKERIEKQKKIKQKK